MSQAGASSWTTSRRQSFANDLSHPQLIAVTDNVNSAKGDRSPDVWKPPLGKRLDMLLCFPTEADTVGGTN